MSDTAHDLKHIDVRADDLAAIQQLCACYFDLADHDDGINAATLFHEHGTLQLGPLKIEGQAAIAEFFDNRAAQNRSTGRLVRHLTGAPLITMDGVGKASARSTIAVFAGAGPLPLQSAPPATVFDFVDALEQSADGEWQFISRRADVLFTGEGAASFARPTTPSGEE